MIVYGSPQRNVTTAAALAGVRTLVGCAQSEPQAEATRRLLIALGELTQGVADAPDAKPLTVSRLHDALLLVGQALYRRQEPPHALPVGIVEAQLNGVVTLLEAVARLPLPPYITIHQPEGFAFYGLYPEHYFQAAAASPLWQRAPGANVLVIGIRSIGTALGGAVGGALRAHGANVRLITVRPTGHPFARSLPADAGLTQLLAQWQPTAYAIVDEGPGLSGSSFAAVGQALLDLGVAAQAIHFFPAHGHGPGNEAGAAARAVWDVVRICLPPTDGDLPFSLPTWPTAWRDLRRPLAQRPGWGALPPFERPTQLIATPHAVPTTLLSFAGLGTYGETAHVRAVATAQAGYALAPSGWSHGWLATPWTDRPPLTAAAFSSNAIQQLASYLAHASAIYSEPGAAGATLDTLLEMLYWNAWEALGEEAAEATRRYADPLWRAGLADAPLLTPPPGLRPDEWQMDAAGRLQLILPLGRRHSHPLPALADPAWALAAVVADFAFDPATEAAFYTAYVAAGGSLPSPARRRFYRPAYAAFAAGRSKLEAAAGGDWAAYGAACDRLRQLLAADDSGSGPGTGSADKP